MISSARYWFLMVLVFTVYIIGLFATLFENDSAQFAVMAMRMVQENDFMSLFKGPNDYLDKPHMHYWLAALSFKVFGIHDWAYRIPGLLLTFLAAYSCYGLGKLLYNKDVGRFSALIFMTAQTIVLSAIDVRTDAVLTGFTIFSIWQLVSYVEKGHWIHIVLGALGAGLAFSTKGQIAILVIGICLLCHLAYSRQWERLANWKVLLALVVFCLAISPMLYAYYQQFDLHPEKIIRGRSGRSGVFFILWEQSFERLSGDGHGKNSSDFLFFFHTFLWVFLPWTVLAIFAIWWRTKTFLKIKFRYRTNFEFLTLGGIFIIFFIISFAQFKLPHYLNIIIPLYAILTASYLHRLYESEKGREIRFLLGLQYFILSLVFIFVLLVCFYVFKHASVWNYVLLFAVLIGITYFCLKQEAYYMRIITLSVCSSLLVNVVLNGHFYPELLNYQGGSEMAERVAENNIDVESIYKLGEFHTWALDFYNQKPVKITSLIELSGKNNVWVYGTEKDLEKLKTAGFDWDEQIMVDQFRITRLSLKFLDPATRYKQLSKRYLVHLY
ncbi:MAG: glycosyltransferase family 39 protein [Allomuricauda sp.]|nr:MAG: glycosyltransferase family 39 protein [Allomuricauda sp.]